VIGNRDFGNPPLSEVPLAVGAYDVQLKCPDAESKSAKVTIAAGQTRTEVMR
jgi:hypothetical protein